MAKNIHDTYIVREVSRPCKQLGNTQHSYMVSAMTYDIAYIYMFYTFAFYT